MEASVRGLPLLSGTAPIVEEPNRHGCRKCGKEFGLFTRARACNHCGFQYCTSCSDHQALVARKNDSGESTGYDSVAVCAFCIPNLTITASGRTQLRAQPVSTLRAYLKAYGLSAPANVLEKEEIVDAVIAARGPDGCIPPSNEDYYRKHSVPNRTPEKKSRSLFSRMADMAASAASGATGPSSSSSSSSSTSAPRPNQHTRPQTSTPQPANNGQQRRAFPNPQQFGPPQQPSQYNIPSNSPYSYRPPGAPTPPPQPAQGTRPRAPGTPSPNNANRPAQGAAPGSGPAAPQSTRPTPAAPVPSMDSLLEMSPEDIHALSVGTLKSILYENHVIAAQILEKDDLVTKVQFLVDNERRDRAREAEIHALEEQAYLEQQRVMREEFARQQAERERAQAQRDADRMSVDFNPAAQAGETAEHGDDSHPVGSGLDHDHDHEHEHDHSDHEHLDVPGDRSSVHSHTSAASATAPVPRPGTAASPSSGAGLGAGLGVSGSPTPSAFSASKAYNVPPATVERSGLCVICQDEEANIVVVDCGHLAMCRNCSDLVMNTNRECPLCRTRIVTPQRLLRVFRT